MFGRIAIMILVAIIVVPPFVVILRTFTTAMVATGTLSAQDTTWVLAIPIVLSLAPIAWVGNIIYKKFVKKDEGQRYG